MTWTDHGYIYFFGQGTGGNIHLTGWYVLYVGPRANEWRGPYSTEKEATDAYTALHPPTGSGPQR